MPRENDIPNTVLGKFISLEFLAMLVVVGISWGAITARVAALDEKIDDHKLARMEQVSEINRQTEHLNQEVIDINRKLDVMGNNQEHFKRQIDAVDVRLEKIQELLETQHRDAH